jgi:LuxR family maltose regulon positive regulatory protein
LAELCREIDVAETGPSENQGNTRGWARLSAAAVLERARLCLIEGRIDEATEHVNRLERLAAAHPAPTRCAWSDIHRYTALGTAYVASAEQRFDDAIPILDRLRQELESARNLHLALRVETHLTTVRFRAKQIAEALASFGGIVTAFARAGIYHTILDEGPEVGPLLTAYRDASSPCTGLSAIE